jgi:glucose-1-phosphate cytidylyltransferase
MLTYADGLADVDLSALIRHHRGTEALITVTAVRPPARFGRLRLDGPKAVAFAEKAGLEEDWINGGYMLCAGELLASLDEEEELEAGLLRRLAAEGRLGAHRHRGFWQCMDTPREAALLNRLWQRGEAPWKRWSEA